MGDHDRIWLSPRCTICVGNERMWCQNNEWAEGCDPPGCALMPTEYVRVDLAVAPPADVAAQERERCAAIAENHEWFVGGIGTTAPGSGQARAIAAAIGAVAPPTTAAQEADGADA